MSLRQLRERLFAALASEVRADQLAFQLISFGFKHGVPLEADLVFDTRFLQNPYYVPELRDHSGLTPPVREYVMSQPGAREFLERVEGLLEFGIPAFIEEGKSRLTIAIGCTGGRHRSVTVADRIRRSLEGRDGVVVRVKHRDLE